MKKIMIKKPGMPPEIVETEVKYRYSLKEYISNDRGVLLEHVPMAIGNGICAIVDEEGIPKQLDKNVYVTTSSTIHPVQLLFGTAIFCRLSLVDNDNYDYQVEGLTDDELLVIKFLLSNEQTIMENEFNKLYSSFDEYKSQKIISF